MSWRKRWSIFEKPQKWAVVCFHIKRDLKDLIVVLVDDFHAQKGASLRRLPYSS